MYPIRGQGPTPADATYHLHRAPRTSPHQLCRNGGNRSHGQEACGKDMLVVVDHFTRYVQAFVTKNHTARTMARVLYNTLFSVFGFPQRLMSDQGTKFFGKVIAVMCSLLGIETTLYHPQTNGSAEKSSPNAATLDRKLDPEKRQSGRHTSD